MSRSAFVWSFVLNLLYMTQATAQTPTQICEATPIGTPAPDIKRALALGRWEEAQSYYEMEMVNSKIGDATWEQACIGILDCIRKESDWERLLAESNGLLLSATENLHVAAASLAYANWAELMLCNSRSDFRKRLSFISERAELLKDCCGEISPWYAVSLLSKSLALLGAGDVMAPQTLVLLEPVLQEDPNAVAWHFYANAAVTKARLLSIGREYTASLDVIEDLFRQNPNFIFDEPAPQQVLWSEAYSILGDSYVQAYEWKRAARFAREMLSWQDKHGPLEYDFRKKWRELLHKAKRNMASPRDFDLEVFLEKQRQEITVESEDRNEGILHRIRESNLQHAQGEFGLAQTLYLQCFKTLGSEDPLRFMLAEWIRDGYILAGSCQQALDFSLSLTPFPWKPESPEHSRWATLLAETVFACHGAPAVLDCYNELVECGSSAFSWGDVEIGDNLDTVAKKIDAFPQSDRRRDALIACLDFFLDSMCFEGGEACVQCLTTAYRKDLTAAQAVAERLEIVTNAELGVSIGEAALAFSDLEPELLRLTGAFRQATCNAQGAVELLSAYRTQGLLGEKYPLGLLALGTALSDLGEYRDTREVLQNLVDEFPEHVSARKASLLIAYSFINEGIKDNAIEALERTILDYPRTLEAVAAYRMLNRLDSVVQFRRPDARRSR